jgi:hypothetical protein
VRALRHGFEGRASFCGVYSRDDESPTRAELSCHGRYWARTSDPKLVESRQALPPFAARSPKRPVVTNSQRTFPNASVSLPASCSRFCTIGPGGRHMRGLPATRATTGDAFRPFPGGCPPIRFGRLTWPHFGRLIWPHPRPTATRPFGPFGARAGGRRGDGIEGGAVRADP